MKRRTTIPHDKYLSSPIVCFLVARNDSRATNALTCGANEQNRNHDNCSAVVTATSACRKRKKRENVRQGSRCRAATCAKVQSHGFSIWWISQTPALAHNVYKEKSFGDTYSTCFPAFLADAWGHLGWWQLSPELFQRSTTTVEAQSLP